MAILPETYCGDEELKELLEKAGARLSVSQIYGLFYGCIASPHTVSPSQYYPLIFGEEEGSHDSIEDTTALIINLLALWDLIRKWDPENEEIALPAVYYSGTYEGTAQRLRDNYDMIELFIKGLDLGHAAESDFSKGGFDALRSLSETGAFIHDLAEIMKNEKNRNNEQLGKALESVEHLEEAVGDCIATMNLSLKKARDREKMHLTMLHDPDTVIPGDSICLCGSGKKYKRCCGVVH